MIAHTMRKYFLHFLLLFPCALFSAQDKPSITVNNRVLATVHGKPISVIDVMKKLDLLFYRQYPEYIGSHEARYHFYMAHWQRVFNDLVDRELVVAEAEEKSFVVSNGDVREELEEIFGPDVMLNLDSAGLMLEDAWEMVKADILIRRMLYMQVHARVFPQITPKKIAEEYQKKIVGSGMSEEYAWSTISVRSQEKEAAANIAEAAYNLVVNEKVPLDELQKKLESAPCWNPQVSLSISPTFRQTLHNLTPQMRELFTMLAPGECSKPLLQTSKADQVPVMRLYVVHEKVAHTPPPLAEVESKLKEALTQELVAAGTQEYFARLRHHFDSSPEAFPTSFKPFELK